MKIETYRIIYFHIYKMIYYIGTYMIVNSLTIARACNRQFFAARFLTVDADIEHDEGVLAFYRKNGFVPNAELYNKNRKTISLRKDIYR